MRSIRYYDLLANSIRGKWLPIVSAIIATNSGIMKKGCLGCHALACLRERSSYLATQWGESIGFQSNC